jgi:hypothetical protein
MPEFCRVCAKPIEQPARGRRKVYCSITCRRTQEAAIARLRAALTDVEAKIQRHTARPSPWGNHQLPILLPKRERILAELAELTG